LRKSPWAEWCSLIAHRKDQAKAGRPARRRAKTGQRSKRATIDGKCSDGGAGQVVVRGPCVALARAVSNDRRPSELRAVAPSIMWPQSTAKKDRARFRRHRHPGRRYPQRPGLAANGSPRALGGRPVASNSVDSEPVYCYVSGQCLGHGYVLATREAAGWKREDGGRGGGDQYNATSAASPRRSAARNPLRPERRWPHYELFAPSRPRARGRGPIPRR